MDFYYQANLVMNDFVSSLLRCRMGEGWQTVSIGFPALEFDYQRGLFLIKFLTADGKSTTFRSYEHCWNVSFEQESTSILLESKSDDTDQAIVFKKTSSFAEFCRLYSDFRSRSELKRCAISVAVNLHLLEKFRHHQAQVLQNPSTQQKPAAEPEHFELSELHKSALPKPASFPPLPLRTRLQSPAAVQNKSQIHCNRQQHAVHVGAIL